MKSDLIKALLAFAFVVLLIVGQPFFGSPTRSTNSQLVAVDLTRLPLGDGKISSSPVVGSVWACRRRTEDDEIGGAHTKGFWIKDDGTFDFTAKIIVDGENTLPHQFKFTLQDNQRIITGNSFPDHSVGTFPIAQSDDAYQYDRNPNQIEAQNLQIRLPAVPSLAEQPSCVRPGAIGVLLTGGYFFNALDADDRDALAYETQDRCQGHPEFNGVYHYHNLTMCLKDVGKGHSALVGYALDGFGIYGHRGENGKVMTNRDLDACHGHTHPIVWDGKMMNLYHYHATWEYPIQWGVIEEPPFAFPEEAVNSNPLVNRFA